MAYADTQDGMRIFYKDWGSGPIIAFSHGWPLGADAWEGQLLFFAQHGFRVIAHDRRGHQRSDQAADGNDVDSWADDLEAVFAAADVRDATLVAHSTGGGEIARYVGRHGTRRVARMVFASAIVPQLAAGPNNPDGAPKEALDALGAGLLANRAQLYRDVADGPFFGNNRPGANVSQGARDDFWRMSMMGGALAHFATIASWSVDYSDDLRKIDKPILAIHGSDDQIVPVKAGAGRIREVVPHAEVLIYDGAPHGLPVTHAERFNADVLAFAKA